MIACFSIDAGNYIIGHFKGVVCFQIFVLKFNMLQQLIAFKPSNIKLNREVFLPITVDKENVYFFFLIILDSSCFDVGYLLIFRSLHTLRQTITVYIKSRSLYCRQECCAIDPALIHATEAVLKERDKPVISKSRIQVCAPA